jgi:hypothetical protein
MTIISHQIGRMLIIILTTRLIMGTLRESLSAATDRVKAILF